MSEIDILDCNAKSGAYYSHNYMDHSHAVNGPEYCSFIDQEIFSCAQKNAVFKAEKISENLWKTSCAKTIENLDIYKYLEKHLLGIFNFDKTPELFENTNNQFALFENRNNQPVSILEFKNQKEKCYETINIDSPTLQDSTTENIPYIEEIAVNLESGKIKNSNILPLAAIGIGIAALTILFIWKKRSNEHENKKTN